MPERLYKNFTAHKIPFHLDHPPLKTPLIQTGIDYLERCGGGFLLTRVRVDEEIEVAVSLDVREITDKNEDEICAMFGAKADAIVKHLAELPSAYHIKPTRSDKK